MPEPRVPPKSNGMLDSCQTEIPPKYALEIWRELVYRSSLDDGPGEPACSEGAVWHAWLGPTGRWCELHGLGRPVGEGSTRSSTVAHHVGTGEPCPPMEEQRD